MTEHEEVGHGELRELEESVVSIFALPESGQARAFAALRERYPHRAALLQRWERAALAIDRSERSPQTVSAALERSGIWSIPEEIAGYKILDVLGEGGMGIVYLAEQQQPVRRRVALKVVRSGLDSGDVIARFESERQALAIMTHSNIAKVLDAGTTDDGRPFFALEHVPGMPITEFCDHHKLAVRERIELFQKVCGAVQHAHQKGVVHRDLKPGNILVQARDGYSEPKVIDFGVAKALQSRLTERTLYTEQGRILGTPEYMSPEQAEMSILDIDTRSDIYALGVLLYELLSGELPFDSVQLHRAGFFEMQRIIREEEPLRPSTKSGTLGGRLSRVVAARRRTDPAGLRKALDGDLDWITIRCLEKDPARRYASASELAADLQRHLDDEPVTAGPPSMWYRLRKLSRKHRGPLAAAAAIFLGLAVGLSIALWQWDEARDAAEAARTNEKRASDAQRRASENLARAELELTHTRASSLVAASDRVLERDPVAALLLALKAVDLDRTPATLGQVQTALAEQYLVAEFRGHTDEVTCADFGPIHRRVLTGSADGTVRLWDETGEALAVLPHGGPVHDAEFSGDEQQILTVADRGEYQIARRFGLDGRLLGEIGGDGEQPLERAVWHGPSSRLLVRYADGSNAIAILDASGESLRDLAASSGSLRPGGLFFSTEGHAVLSRTRRVTIWYRDGGDPVVLRAEEGQEFATSYFEPGDSIAFDPTGSLIATIEVRAQSPGARLWSTDGNLLKDLTEHSYHVKSVRFAPSGDAVLTASADGTARVWDLDGHRCAVATPGGNLLQARFFGSDHRFLTAGLTPLSLWNDTGRKITECATGAGIGGAGYVSDSAPDQGLVLWCTSRRAQLWRLGGVEDLHLRCDGDRPWYPARHPGGMILAGSEDGRVFAWDEDGHVIREFTTGGDPVYGIAVSPDGSRVVAGGRAGMVYAWDWNTQEPLWARKVSFEAMTWIFYLSSGLIWAHSAPNQGAYLVDPVDGTSELLFGPHRWGDDPIPSETGPLRKAMPAPDGATVAVWGVTGYVLLCDGQAHRLGLFRAHDAAIEHVAFHPGGEIFATASIDGSVKLWDLDAVLAAPSEAEPLRTIHPETAPAIVEFSPDGTHMLIEALSRAYVLDLDGNVLFHFWPAGGMTGFLDPACFFSNDGKWIIGKAFDGVRRWPAREDDLLRMARKWADRLGAHRDLSEFSDLLGK